MDNTLLGYAILDYFSEKGMDVLDTYIPLFCKAIMAENLTVVDRDTMKRIVAERYGMSAITLGAIDSILKRMVHREYLKKEHYELCINKEKIIEFVNERPEANVEDEFNYLAEKISQYAKEKFDELYSIEDISNALVVFLDKHGSEFVFDKENVVSKLNRQTARKEIGYVLSSFVLNAYKQNYEDIRILTKLAKGRIIARVVTLSEFNSYIGKLDKVEVALDAPVLFNLLGLNGDAGHNLTVELLEILRKNGAKFIIFNNNYREITNTLSAAIWRLRTHDWEYNKSSRVLKYAIRNHVDHFYLQTKLAQVESLLDSWQIERVDAPDYPDRYKEIDMERLTDIISRKYSNNGEIELDENQKARIATDVDSISYIFRIRGNSPAMNLKQCKAILVTNNAAISYASNDGKISTIRHNIPPCVTDVFLSTILWTAYPGDNKDLNDKILLCECASNLLLDDEIIKSYYNKVNQLNQQQRITKEQVLILTSTNLAMDLLERHTLNDPERFTDETPEEILREIEEGKNKKINNAHKNLSKLSRGIAAFIFGALWLLMMLVFCLKFIDYSTWNAPINWILATLQALAGFWGVLSWGGFIWSKANIISYLDKRIYRLISNKLFQND